MAVKTLIQGIEQDELISNLTLNEDEFAKLENKLDACILKFQGRVSQDKLQSLVKILINIEKEVSGTMGEIIKSLNDVL